MPHPDSAPTLSQPASGDPDSHPTRDRARSFLGWSIVVVLVLAVSFLGLFLAVASPDRGTLDPDSPGPGGARALAELVRSTGTEVSVTRSWEQARRQLTGETILVTTHPRALSDEAVSTLISTAPRAVILSGDARLLRLLELGDSSSALPHPETAECPIPAFARIGTVTPQRMFDPAPGVSGCFPGPEGSAGVLITERAGRSLALLEASTLFSNEALASQGNAALGLALLAQSPRVIWYVPSPADTDLTIDDLDSLGSLTPPWVTPAVLLLGSAAVAAALWRGRRFGPLVREALPVTVRASETMEGRARLTAQAGDAAHAAAALREGARNRLNLLLGLQPSSDAAAREAIVAERSGIDREQVATLLHADLPHTDADLIDFARRLQDLETAVQQRTRTERTTR